MRHGVLILAASVMGAAAGVGLSAATGVEILAGHGAVGALETQGAPMTAVPGFLAATPGNLAAASGNLAAASASSAAAPQEDPNNPAYNGRFTYVRIRFGDSGSNMRSFGRGGRRGRGGGAPWSHDYPRAEVNFSKIVSATTFVDNYMEGNAGRILSLDDPELFRYPVATIIEPGFWQPSEEEVEALRSWLLKGGFLIADDFRGDWEIDNLQRQLRRVLPEHFIQYVPDDHEIFNSFFYIEDPTSLVHPYQGVVPQYLGIYSDNDPVEGRIMVMINWNQDLQEYWEFSDRGYYPIDLSNEAYQFGVNYLIYAFTH